jgi:hypothetical protein
MITSRTRKSLQFTALVGLLAVGMSANAHANYLFSGSGLAGTLVGPDETWVFNADGGAAVTGQLNDWGSPGVGLTTALYDEADSAYGMTLSFLGGGIIDTASITIGNGASCVGSTGGGTTFCAVMPGLVDYIWQANLISPDTITFLAPSPSVDLTSAGVFYFVNVFFDGATPTSFTGAWLTGSPTATPLPSTWLMLLSGCVGFGFFTYRGSKKTPAAPATA